MIANDASDMTEDQAKRLEQAVAQKPDDITARTKLLGYYFLRRTNSPAAKAARQKHILWLIENRPESEIAGSPYAGLDPVLDGDAFAEAKALWLKQVEQRPDDPAVLRHAASTLLLWDPETAEKLLERGKKLQQDNPEWPRQLAHLYQLRVNDASTPEARKKLAQKAVTEQRQAVELSPVGTERFYRLSNLPEMALEAGQFEESRAAAEELLAEARRYPKDWNYGNAIHKGHSVLGRLALHSGDIAEAKRHLLEAGKTPGSPQLNSFGPDMTLAAALLRKGEREAVIQYLRAVSQFWELGEKQVSKWIKTIEAGLQPDFGPAARFLPADAADK